MIIFVRQIWQPGTNRRYKFALTFKGLPKYRRVLLRTGRCVGRDSGHLEPTRNAGIFYEFSTILVRELIIVSIFISFSTFNFYFYFVFVLKIIFVLVSVLVKRKFIIFVSVSISVHENITAFNHDFPRITPSSKSPEISGGGSAFLVREPAI